MHPRVSVSAVSSRTWSFDEDLALWTSLGVSTVGLLVDKLPDDPDDAPAVATRLADAGLHVGSLLAPGPFRLDQPERWPDQREEMGRIMDVALALRPDVLVLTTGSAGTLPWERAADALDEVLRGTVLEAEREGLELAIEHTDPLQTDVGFLHSLRDAVDVSWRLGTRVCLELSACWAERNLAGTIAAAPEQIALVQVSDGVVAGRTTPDRLVPGDGELPLRRILGQLLDAGYEGWFELELVGPRIEDEGYASAVGRGVEALTAILEDLERVEEDDADDDGDDGAPDGDAERAAGEALPADVLWEDPLR